MDTTAIAAALLFGFVVGGAAITVGWGCWTLGVLLGKAFLRIIEG